jgi:secreted trypsin-like serine protease
MVGKYCERTGETLKNSLLLLGAGLLIAAQPAPEPAPNPGTAAETPPAPEDEGSRVVRGTPAPPGSSPWQIQVYFKVPMTKKEIEAAIRNAPSEPERQALRTMEGWERDHLCGGALIDKEWALSAAHCFVVEKETLVKLPNLGVRLGNIDLKAATPKRIDRIIVHGDYRRFGHKQHDIALLHLVDEPETKPEIAAAATPVRLIGERMRALSAGDDLKVTGWGHVSERKAGATRSVNGDAMRSSQVLLEGQLELLDESECRKVPDYQKTLNPGVLCVGARTSAQQDSCQGDSGGPLTRQRILVGLVSTGVGCGRKGVPALYTNVAHYAEWIATVQQEVKTSGVTRCVVVQSGPRKLTCSAKLNPPRTNRG